MNNEQLQIFLDSHGAEPARWPAAQRDTVERLIAHDPAAHSIFAEARQLDALLARVHDVDTDDAAATARVLARLSSLPRQKRPFWHWPSVLLDWQFMPAWPRVVALAGCAAVGFMIGIAGLDRPVDRLDAQSMIASRDIGWVFEPEAITGANP